MQKNRKSNDEQDGDKQNKARLIIDNEKQDPFPFQKSKTHFHFRKARPISRVFDCDLQDALVILIFLNKY